MYQFPLKYFENNLIFNNVQNECWAAYKMNGFNYDFRSNEGKINILNSLARFISNIGVRAKILIVPIGQDIDTHYKTILDNIDKKDPIYKSTRAHAEQTSIYLKDKIKNKGNANDYKVYILTKLKLNDNVIEDLKDAFLYFINEPFQAIEDYLGLETRDILEKNIRSFEKLSDEYYKKQSRRIAITKCNEMDVQWLIKRPFYRGIGEFKLRGTENEMWTPFAERLLKNGEAYIRPNSREILTLTEGALEVQGRTIKIDHGDKKCSYQTFLTVAHIPDGIMFPGNEWLLALQDYPIQTEVCINIDTIEHKQSLKNIDKKKREIKDQIEHIQKSDDDLPDEILESREYADMLEAELKASRSPMSNVSITFCLFSDNASELEDRVNFIKELYTDNNFIIERPITDQLKLFMEFLPGTERYVGDYIQRLPPRTLAGGMIGATRLLGDNIGPYIGTTGVLEKNVFLDIARACKLNRSASACFLGTLGGGKSFGANLLFYLAVLYGARGFVIDPKGERSNWIKDLPEFKDQINIITLSSEPKDKGKLDPFLIYKNNLDEAGYLALSILSELFKLNPNDDEYLVVLEAIEWAKKQESPNMIKVAERLMNFPEEDEFSKVANKVGRKIKLLREAAMAGLLFSNGEENEEGLNFDKKINILQIQNLAMPSPDKPKEDYTQDEILSTVLMLPIASFARKFIHLDRSFFKVTLFDEAWALSATTQGNQMMSALIREGRALNAGCLFISQSTKDLRGEGIKTNISYKFCFKATEINEVKSVLEFLDLETTDENISEVRSLQNGECLFQDLDGRVGKLKVDAVFEHLIKRAFNTNPEKEKKDGEKGEKTA